MFTKNNVLITKAQWVPVQARIIYDRIAKEMVNYLLDGNYHNRLRKLTRTTKMTT